MDSLDSIVNSDNKNSKTAAISVISRDEMNLAEFPLTVLSTRINPKIKTLEFRDTIISKNGKEINREWIITGTDKFGLPTSSDDEVLLGLLKLTVEDKFQNKKVYFTRYELMKILRWATEGKNYKRLQLSLDRLSGVRIKATNAFFDNEAKNYSTKNFGILDAYEINDGRENRHKPSFFIWSDEIFQSFQSGFIKKIDLDFFLDLNSAISKRLYRFLDKNFWYKSRVKMNLFILAHEKIGISRNYKYASALKQQLETAIEELSNLGFISGVEYEGRGKDTQIIIYSADEKPRSVIGKKTILTNTGTDKEANQSKALYIQEKGSIFTQVSRALSQRGLKENQVQNLLSAKSDFVLKKIAKIVEYYDHLLRHKSNLVSKSPIGFLYRAVEKAEDFILPDGFSLNTTIQKPRKKKIDKNSVLNQELDVAYKAFLRAELTKIQSETDEHLIAEIKQEADNRLSKVKNLISPARYQESLDHAVEQKLIRLFAVPGFEEWKKEQIH